MLRVEWKKYFDGEFNPDPVYGTDSRGLQTEEELTEFLRKHCKAAFVSEEAYTEFEESIFGFTGMLQIVASEAGFEKGVLCGMMLAKEK